MAEENDPSSIFGKVALFVTTLIAVTMASGGLMYFSDYANSLFSKFAGLFITYTGGWMMISIRSDALGLLTDIIRSSKDLIIAVIKTLLRYLAV